ncbi:MAG: hypothetical protein LBM98_08825 [Oscillospiraceae bacterium]|nr:hypothetical protein [Oscillospiraceae bacterium]
MRYVGRYRCEAIQCRGDNIRMLRSRHWIAARLNALRIASAAALAMTGRAKPCPVPAHYAGTVDVGYGAHGAGNHPAAMRCVPSQEGNGRVRARRGYNPRLCGGTPF